MSSGTKVRLTVALLILAVGFYFLWRANLDPGRLSLLLTATICFATALYALITLEILIQNQSMARAASDSAKSMERGLRFSHACNLLYRTFVTKDPSLASRNGCAPIRNEDYVSALRGYTPGQKQMEFVFCEVQNVGRGPATNLAITAEYKVHDASNSTKFFTVKKEAVMQLLESDKSAAVLICLFSIPTAGDSATLVSASVKANDYYRDALEEPPVTSSIGPQNHHFEPESDCTVRLA
jgi:hypothetical protein